MQDGVEGLLIQSSPLPTPGSDHRGPQEFGTRKVISSDLVSDDAAVALYRDDEHISDRNVNELHIGWGSHRQVDPATGEAVIADLSLSACGRLRRHPCLGDATGRLP